MDLNGFINKHRDKIGTAKDTINKIQDMTESVPCKTATPGEEAVLESYLSSIIKGTSIESLRSFIKSVTKGTFTVTETLVNEIIKNYTPDLSIKFGDGHFILNTPYFVKPMLAYDTCNFTEDTRAITIKLLNLTFIPNALLKTLTTKFPFIELSKAADNTKLITCHLNKIPKLENNKILNSPYLQFITIDHITCEAGKATIKLKVKSEKLWAMLLNNAFSKT
ncbi:MAG: hypothetical protein DWB56_12155 [Candidatus Jettenia sp.]|uniref:Uncharacterized protein n=1 Tax=Candidatus Jettenia caeni TaxID=247490 RepID=I3IGW5_9BACT|nr:hypothetical protein [Candidatus Jettenia sp. AMX1]MBC6929690.1 hypothetical protein [Candidatus Jettenia sp.]NUN22648.1 hypothetical protein [Candidatus Jettenia caeni]KAA0248944.1 MAG: hypothetical protein EDM77_10615 [Candidatus Jettenia sp. AMX1]MCE7881262.1 hypothetical protein [Candidatus Jettenia sp. AMX1]MCQ3928103.1 hypothetical protein [Candidatus Jettenia sp.]